MIHCRKNKSSNNKIIPAILIILLQIVVQTSCVKEPLYNTDHPNHGRIISLTTDWTNRGEGIDIPDNHTLKAGDYTTTLSGTTNEVNNYFEAGAYHINIWNTANNVSVAGNIASADYQSPPAGDSGGLGWLFTGSQDEIIEKDKDYAFTVPMQQQVRQLTLVLEVTGSAKDKIAAVDATLSGVAGAINIDNGNPVGNAVTVTPVFTSPDCRDAMHCVSTATIRLLGITGNAQTLTLTLHLEEGNPSSYTITSDLADQLAAFNADRKTPLTLKSAIEVTATESGFSAIIDPWTGNGGTIIAN